MKRTLKGIRADLGLTQKEMAEKLNMSESAYRAKENKTVKLFADELMAISNMSGIPCTEIDFN